MEKQEQLAIRAKKVEILAPREYPLLCGPNEFGDNRLYQANQIICVDLNALGVISRVKVDEIET